MTEAGDVVQAEFAVRLPVPMGDGCLLYMDIPKLSAAGYRFMLERLEFYRDSIIIIPPEGEPDPRDEALRACVEVLQACAPVQWHETNDGYGAQIETAIAQAEAALGVTT